MRVSVAARGALLCVFLAGAVACSTAATAAPLSRDSLQASLSTLATLEARHDYAAWQKLAQSLFAPNAVIIIPSGVSSTQQTLPQYLAAERKNMTLSASATGAVEHDYVQSFQRGSGGAAAASSELTMHMHEITSQGPTEVDVIIGRQYALHQQGGSWRITRLVAKPTALYINGKLLSLRAPQRKPRQ